jgi:hypothetical protein
MGSGHTTPVTTPMSTGPAQTPDAFVAAAHEPASTPSPVTEASVPPAPPALELEQLQEAWQRSIVPAVEDKSIPVGSVLKEARPSELAGDTLTLEFPPSAAFHRQLAEEPKNAGLLRDALYELTGRKLAVAFAEGVHGGDLPAEDVPVPGEDELYELMKETFDARDVEE